MATSNHSTSALGFSVRLASGLDEAIAHTKAALATEGFGVLSTIDVAATLKQKLGAEMEPYVILGACNPALAQRAIAAEHEIGLLLPCNVLVHQHDDGTVVSFVSPHAMLAVVGDNNALQRVADEAEAGLKRAAQALQAQAG